MNTNRGVKILLLYARGNQEITNRQSALGSYLHCLCRLLSAHGFEIQFNDLPFEKLHHLSNGTAIANPVARGKWKFIPAVLKNFIKDVKKIKEIKNLKSSIANSAFHPDILIEFYNYGSDLGVSLSQQYKVPLLEIYDAPVLEEYEFFNGKKLFFRRLIETREMKTLKAASAILVYSNAVKNHLLQKNSALHPDSFYIHQNVDFTRFDFQEPKAPPDIPVIGFVGSFLKWHRVDLLLDAFEKLLKKGIKARLILVGSGAEFENIKNRVVQSGNAENIQLTGFLDGDDLKAIKSQMHIGIMPGSNWYGAPNKIFEYGAAGMAVIAPDTPTIKELFASEEILLFKWDDANDLEGKLQHLITDQATYQRLSSSLHKKIKSQYSEKLTLEFYTQIINKLDKK